MHKVAGHSGGDLALLPLGLFFGDGDRRGGSCRLSLSFVRFAEALNFYARNAAAVIEWDIDLPPGSAF